MGRDAAARAQAFCTRYGLRLPLLLAPMAGACPASLSIAVANAGGMAAMGALVSQPDAILSWVAEVRAASSGPIQLNTWMPDPAPRRDPSAEARLRSFIERWGPHVPPAAGDVALVDVDLQCEAFLETRPAAVSSIMGLLPPRYVERLKAAGIAWFATATTLAEARAAQAAGADAVVAQGFEAGGHRGAFDAGAAERQTIGLFALVPRLADHLQVPVIAAGGIGDGRGVAAALTLGASAVSMGTVFLRCPEAGTPAAQRAALADAHRETTVTRAFTGRPARGLVNRFITDHPDAPSAYPNLHNLTRPVRAAAAEAGDPEAMSMWAGQAYSLAGEEPVTEVLTVLAAQARQAAAAVAARLGVRR